MRKAWRTCVAFAAAAVVVAGSMAATASVAQAATNPSAPPTMTLGTYQTSEDSSNDFIPIAGAGHPNVANTYLSWGQGLPTTFMNSAHSQGATPYVEIEAWQEGTNFNAVPSFSAIAANGDASDTNCSLDENTYNTSCATWLADLGQAIASYGHPVVLTFAHEFNVGGQYPWAAGYSACEKNNPTQCPPPGSCGTTDCTPSQWIAAWDEVQSIVDENAGGNAYWMWAPNADTGGTPDTGGTTDPSPYWPGASHVDLVGVDGYPDTEYGSQFGTFSGEFGQTFSEIRNLGYTGGIFISETNLARLDGSGYETVPQFVSDLCAAGGTGFLEWEDEGATPMTSTQWGEANTALANDCAGGSTPPAQAPVVVTGAVSGVTSTSATLNGTVNPEGAATTYQFQYGTSTSYGSVTPVSPASAGSGSSAIGESAGLSGLSASTTYDYRLVATNATGTTDGGNQTFTTPATSPPGNAFTPVGGLIQGTSLKPSVTAHAVGDVILLHVTTEGSAPPTGISGGDATWKQVGTTVRGSVNSGLSAAVYEGTVTTAGTAQATVTASGTPSAVRIGGQEYNVGSGQTGVLVAQANLDVAGTGTGPSITPTGSNELYSFYGFDTGTGTAGSTPGYTYELDNNGNVYVFDPASPAQAPVFGDSNVAFGIAVLLEAAPVQNAFTPVGGLIQGTSLKPSVTAHAVGDVILLHVTTEGSAPPTGISGGDATWKQVGTTVRGSVNSGLSAAVYEGTVTTAGTAQATVTASGTPSAVRIGGQEYNPGSGQTGVLVAQANLDVAGTSTGPSITPTGSNELYSFYGFDTDIGSAGSTSGYTYELDNNGNVYVFDPASPAQAPVFGDSNVAFGIAVLMESAPAGSS